jgi:hypothetical protein
VITSHIAQNIDDTTHDEFPSLLVRPSPLSLFLLVSVPILLIQRILLSPQPKKRASSFNLPLQLLSAPPSRQLQLDLARASLPPPPRLGHLLHDLLSMLLLLHLLLIKPRRSFGARVVAAGEVDGRDVEFRDGRGRGRGAAGGRLGGVERERGEVGDPG